ncbi:MAG: PEGA domain-containing protein [Myxococcota bacterium]
MIALLLAASVLAQSPKQSDGVVMLEAQDARSAPLAGVVVAEEGLVVTPTQAVGQRRRVKVLVRAGEERVGVVSFRDDELGLALITLEPAGGLHALPLYGGAPVKEGARVNVRGMEGGLPWSEGSATVVGTQTGPWGNLARGYLTCDAVTEGTGADVGAAVLAPDNTLLGVHLGPSRARGAPSSRFIVLGTDVLRGFIRQATYGMPVATLRISSQVSSARAFVDGKDVGQVPVTVPRVTVGWHSIKVVAPGHGPQERLVEATLESAPWQHFDLKPAAMLVFSSNAPNTVYSLDGNAFLPLTGEAIPVPEGKRTVEFTAPGYRRAVWQGSAEAGRAISHSVELVKQHGKVTITSEPVGARLFIDGRDLGVTPARDVEVVPGRRQVELQMAHHRVAALQGIDVKDGDVLDLGTIKLQPMPARITLAAGLPEDDDEVFLNGKRVDGRSWRVEPGYHEVEIRRPWHKPGRIRMLVGPEENRVLAPRPEALPEASERRIKMGLAALSGIGGVAATTAGVVMLASGVGLLVGAKLAYDRYHVVTTRQDMDTFYNLANGLMWGGTATAVASGLGIVGLLTAIGVAVLSVVTLPTDPSGQYVEKPSVTSTETPTVTPEGPGEGLKSPPQTEPTPTPPPTTEEPAPTTEEGP